MSTLKTDVLKDVAETVSVNVVDLPLSITLRQDLANATDPAKGAGLVGLNGGNLYEAVKTINFYQFGAVGDGVVNDTAAVLAAIAFVKTNPEFRLEQVGGTFSYGTPIDLTNPPGSREGVTPPLTFIMRCSMKYTGTDKAVKITGNGWAHELLIEDLVGAGVIAEDVQDGPAENIGLYIGPNSGAKITIGTVRKFNHNIVFDGSYFNHLDLNYSYECIYGLTMRRSITTGAAANKNTILARVIGGPFADPSDIDFATDRLMNANVGLNLDGAIGNTIVAAGVEYCVRTDTGYAITLGEDTRYNQIDAHVEGGITNMVVDNGVDNRLNLDGVNSIRALGKSVVIAGIGGEYGSIYSQQVATQITSFAPHWGQGAIEINPTVKVTGPRVQQNMHGSSASAYSFVSNNPGTGSFVLSTPGASSIATSTDLPAQLAAPGGMLSYTLTSTQDNTLWFTVGPASLGGDSSVDMLFSCFLRGVTNNVKVSIFILDEALAFVGAHHTEMRNNSSWQEIKFPFKRGAATSLTYRIALRGFESAGGGVVRFAAPVITTDIASELSYKGYGGKQSRINVPGGVLAEPMAQLFGMVPEPNARAIASTALAVNGAALVVINSAAGGTTVNAFTNVTPGQGFEVLNLSGSTITIAGSAATQAGPTTILNNSSARFINYSGVNYRAGE